MSPHSANLRLSAGDIATGRCHRACVAIYGVERTRNHELAEVQGPYVQLGSDPGSPALMLCGFTPVQIKGDQPMVIPIEAYHTVRVA